MTGSFAVLPKIGLAINPAKCKLFGPATVAASSSLFDGIPRESLAEGSVFLGVPVGSDQFVEDFITAVLLG